MEFRRDIVTGLLRVARELVSNWQSAGVKWLERESEKSYKAWLRSKEGKRFLKRKRKVSPYHAGFSLPDWHHEAIDALNKGDEERFKAIKLRQIGR